MGSPLDGVIVGWRPAMLASSVCLWLEGASRAPYGAALWRPMQSCLRSHPPRAGPTQHAHHDAVPL